MIMNSHHLFIGHQVCPPYVVDMPRPSKICCLLMFPRWQGHKLALARARGTTPRASAKPFDYMMSCIHLSDELHRDVNEGHSWIKCDPQGLPQPRPGLPCNPRVPT